MKDNGKYIGVDRLHLNYYMHCLSHRHLYQLDCISSLSIGRPGVDCKIFYPQMENMQFSPYEFPEEEAGVVKMIVKMRVALDICAVDK